MISPFFIFVFMKEFIFYTPIITSRIKYVLKLFFKDVYQLNYKIVDDVNIFKESTSIKINYSKNKIDENEVFVESSGMLTEKDIKKLDLRFFKLNDVEYLFKSTLQESYLHDVFSSIFYLVSRYEEYLPHLKDNYGRFLPEESIAYQKNFLHKPIVNIWMKKFIDYVEISFPLFVIKKPNFKFISTIDVDNAFLFKGKGFLRSIGTICKSFFNFKNLMYAFSVLRKQRKDPFDTYSFQFNLQKKYKIDVRYFILLGNYGVNDKNLSHTNSSLISLVKRLADFAPVGIHPSFASNLDINIIQTEIQRLEEIQKREVKFSRQHFLQLSLPETYKKLCALGINEDFTMGYSSKLGFRAGISSPFSFYDLDMEQTLPIKVFPFCITDHVLRFNLKIDSNAVISEIQDMINEVKGINGTLIIRWHNDTFSNFGLWKDWKNVYEDIVKLINEIK